MGNVFLKFSIRYIEKALDSEKLQEIWGCRIADRERERPLPSDGEKFAICTPLSIIGPLTLHWTSNPPNILTFAEYLSQEQLEMLYLVAIMWAQSLLYE